MVKAIRGFAARIEGKTYAVAEGDVLEMPAGADWVAAGLVLPLPDPEERKGGKKTRGQDDRVTR